jgi:cytochrome c oxidase subunit 4
MSEHNTEHSAHATHHHISSVGLYWGVWVGLMILTIITVLAYYIPLWLKIDLGSANVIIAMAIATTKATLVCLYFMHLKYDKRFNLIAFLSSLIFLGLFLGFTLLDINTREDAQPFAKPIYTGRDLPLDGGHSSAPAATTTQSPAATVPAASSATSPAAGEAKKEDATSAASTSPAGAAKH